MLQALFLVAGYIARAHDRWRARLKRRPRSGEIAVLEEKATRLATENELFRRRFLRVPASRRSHYQPHERLDILWHQARCRLSTAVPTRTFAVSRQTILNWIRVESSNCS